MEKKYLCTKDSENIYTDKTFTAHQLINDFMDGLNDVEDEDTINWFLELIEHQQIQELVDFVAQAWGLELKIIN